MDQQIIANGGLQYAPEIAVQQVYLEFNGALTDYNGEVLTVGDVNVSASGYDQKTISLIIDRLNAVYSEELFFTDIKPLSGDYSTVYIGKSDFLAEYASVRGISETIDAGNKIKNDNAFVFLDSTSDIGYTTHIIAHEIGHIVYGDTHSGEQKNPYNKTDAYQYYSGSGKIVSGHNINVKAEKAGVKSLPVTLDPALREYCYVLQLLADLTQLYNEYYQLVYKQQYYQKIYAYENLAYKNNNPGANVVVNNWQVAGGTRQVLTNGATASLCCIMGVQSVSFNGSSNQCAAMNGGSIQLHGGTATNNYISGPNASLLIMRNNGYASNTIIDGGTMKIQTYGGSAYNTIVKNGGQINVMYNLAGNVRLYDTCIDSGCTMAIKHATDQITGTYQTYLRGTTYFAGSMIFSSYKQSGKNDVSFSTDYKIKNCGNFIFGADSRTPYDDVMISNMENIYAASDYDLDTNQWVNGSFCVAVSSDMQSGQYRLAGNAGNYYNNHRISILDTETGDEYFHTYGSQLRLGGKTFSVQLNSSDELCLIVKNIAQNPDLQISDLTISSTEVEAGTSLTLKFALKNSGNGDAAASVAGIYDGSQLLYRLNAVPLPVNTSQLFTHVVDTGKMTAGTHNLRIIADIDDAVDESNEENNETNISVQINVSKPDLLISNLTVSSYNLQTGTPVTLSFTVENAGSAAPISTVDIYDGSNYLGSLDVDALPAGESKNFTYVVSADRISAAGEHNFIIEADKNNLIAELDETNNRQSISVQVTAPPDIDLAPYKPADHDDIIVISTETGTHKDASFITTEDKIYIDWNVINQGNDPVYGDFHTALYLDDNLVAQWVTGELLNNYRCHIYDYELGPLSAGEHTLEIITDCNNTVQEKSESNNTYTKTFNVAADDTPGVKIYDGGKLISAGTSFDGILLNSYSSMYISSGGTATGTTVNSNGSMYVSDGGTASCTKVNSGARMYIFSGGTLRGSLHIESGAIVSACSGSIIDFNFQNRQAENDYLINDLLLINGSPTYTITVDVNQSCGVYKLAQGADSFSGRISIGTESVNYGSLTVNGNDLLYNGIAYSLDQTDGDLTLEIKDTAPTDAPLTSADITAATNREVTVTAVFSSDSVVREYSFDNRNWYIYTSGIVMFDNGTVYFRGKNAAGNYSDVASYDVVNIDKVAPPEPAVTADTENPTNFGVTVTAAFSDDCTVKQYRIGNREWQNYVGAFSVSENGTVFFRFADAAGNENTSELVISNIDKTAPAIPVGFNEIISGHNAKLDWSDAVDSGTAGVKGYYVRYGTNKSLSGNGIFVSVSNFDLTALAAETCYYQVKTADNAGNVSDWSAIRSFDIKSSQVQNLQGGAKGLSWDAVSGVKNYIVEYSTDNFANVISFETSGSKIDSIALPGGTYQWRVKAENGEFANGENIVSDNATTPQKFISDADGNMDVFFGKANGKWDANYAAQHNGILNGWKGTKEQINLNGKNKIADVFSGSSDANILVLTDDANGDALFVEDIYTSFGKDAARISQIDEIRAGAGDDIIDMTSQKFAYAGDGVKIYGGLGNDTIWANNGSNTLFGDAGNDRIIGGSGDDLIIGGIGNDSMHGGGGDDIFTFGGDWGNDTVEQLAGGSVTLWFEDGSESNWNASTLTYTDGENSVKVSGVDTVTLKFGADVSLPDGCFANAASEKIFEDKDSGMLA